MVPVGATICLSFKQASIHAGVRIGTPINAERITFKVLDEDTTSIGSHDLLLDKDADVRHI
jgi:hypothetical protein